MHTFHYRVTRLLSVALIGALTASSTLAGMTSSHAIESTFSNGFCYQFVLKNTDSVAYTGWTIGFDVVDAVLRNSYGARFTRQKTTDGTVRYMITALGTNQKIEPGKSTEAGACFRGATGKITNVIVNEGRTLGGASSATSSVISVDVVTQLRAELEKLRVDYQEIDKLKKEVAALRLEVTALKNAPANTPSGNTTVRPGGTPTTSPTTTTTTAPNTPASLRCTFSDGRGEIQGMSGTVITDSFGYSFKVGKDCAIATTVPQNSGSVSCDTDNRLANCACPTGQMRLNSTGGTTVGPAERYYCYAPKFVKKEMVSSTVNTTPVKLPEFVISGVVYQSTPGNCSDTSPVVCNGGTDSLKKSHAESVSYCSTLNYEGHSDWFLPSIQEMIQVYGNRNQLGGLNQTPGISYWTSTPSSSPSGAITMYFDGSSTSAGQNKISPSYLRCIRKTGEVRQTNTSSAAQLTKEQREKIELDGLAQAIIGGALSANDVYNRSEKSKKIHAFVREYNLTYGINPEWQTIQFGMLTGEQSRRAFETLAIKYDITSQEVYDEAQILTNVGRIVFGNGVTTGPSAGITDENMQNARDVTSKINFRARNMVLSLPRQTLYEYYPFE